MMETIERLTGGDPLMPRAIRLREFQELVRQQVDQLPPALFQNLTGFQFHVVWLPTVPSPWNDPELAAQPPKNIQSVASATSRTEPCWSCSADCLAVSVDASQESHCCNCPLDAANRWFPIFIQELVVGFASIRNVEADAGPDVTLRENMAQRAERTHAQETGFLHEKGTEPATPGMLLFDHAMSLLRLIVHHVETSVQAELTRVELAKTRQRAFAHKHEERRSRADLLRTLPAGQPSASAQEYESRPEQLVRRMLKFIEQNLSRPITLQNCADELKLNPVYLCTLFARIVGLPFKAYLIKLRIDTAKRLLSDPVQRTSEVAFAVGYTDEDYFRRAFKAATGSSPAAWRGTLRAKAKPEDFTG